MAKSIAACSPCRHATTSAWKGSKMWESRPRPAEIISPSSSRIMKPQPPSPVSLRKDASQLIFKKILCQSLPLLDSYNHRPGFLGVLLYKLPRVAFYRLDYDIVWSSFAFFSDFISLRPPYVHIPTAIVSCGSFGSPKMYRTASLADSTLARCRQCDGMPPALPILRSPCCI